jgi:hypothetical protein
MAGPEEPQKLAERTESLNSHAPDDENRSVPFCPKTNKGGFSMPYIDPEVVAEAKKIDLLTYLQNYEPHELVRLSGNTCCTRSHDSLKISGGKWMWWSRGVGGRSALDYLIKVRGMGFIDAVEQIMGRSAANPPVPMSFEAPEPKPFDLPKPDTNTIEAERYLNGKRGISRDIIRRRTRSRTVCQTKNGRYTNVVFVGMDKDNIPRYASVRGISGGFNGDVGGSDKRYSFALPERSTHLHLFESAIDLLSFATLYEKRRPDFGGGLLSLSGVYEPKRNAKESAPPLALMQHLKDHADVRHIHLHLDNDVAGRLATRLITDILPESYTVTDEPPPIDCKDFNDCLCGLLGLPRTPIKGIGRAR